MADSTLSIWALVLIIGEVLLVVMGLTNCYVPKEAKEEILRLDRSGKLVKYELELSFRFEGFWFVVITVLTIIPAFIFFLIENFGLVENLMSHATNENIFTLSFIFLMILAIVFLVLMMTPFVISEIMVSENDRYYTRKYDGRVKILR